MKRLVIGILAHVDAGKTTLSEALLYQTGALKKLGRVDHRDAFLDTFALEQERVFAAAPASVRGALCLLWGHGFHQKFTSLMLLHRVWTGSCVFIPYAPHGLSDTGGGSFFCRRCAAAAPVGEERAHDPSLRGGAAQKKTGSPCDPAV